MELVGQILKKNREIKNLSLKDISNELKITEDMVKDIENSSFQDHIDIVFIIGHLRSYSSYLGLNQNELIDQFKKEISPIEPKKIVIDRPLFKKNYIFYNRFFSVSLIFIIFLTFYLLFIENDTIKREYAIIPDLPENYISIVEKANLDNVLKPNINKSIENFASNEGNINSSSAVASAKIIKDDSTLITLKALDPTWVQLRDENNEIIFSQMMNKNDEYSYKSNLNYSITSGNAGHILVLINQKVRGKIGKKGQVVDSLVLDNTFNN